MPVHSRLLTVGVVLMLVLAGCSAVADQDGRDDGPPIQFENATADVGIDYQGTDGGVGAGNNGVYAGDVDNDGWTDLLVIGGSQPALFLNSAGEFDRQSSLPQVDATLKSATFVDFDSDGWEDLLLFTTSGEVHALHNDGGEFERTSTAIDDLTYPLGGTVADYDRDGDHDLLVYQSGSWAAGKPAGYFSPDAELDDDNGNPNVLFENTDDGFERVVDSGITGDRWSLAASFVDLNDDGYPDVHVANDFNTDVVYLNRGDGTFEQQLLGGDTARNGMASEIGDVNGDGKLDVFVANIYIPLEQHRENISADRYARLERYSRFVVKSDRVKGNTLLINRGDGEFVNSADAFGVRRGGWGWAASLSDFDNDGSVDLVQATQIVIRLDPDDPRWTYPMVWRGQNGSGFDRVPNRDHGLDEHDTRGMTTLDYDHDGDRDVVMATYGGRVVVYENVGTAANSIQFEITDERGQTALGATVTVEADGETTTVRQTDENDFLSQESRVQHVGLGEAERVSLTVTWPDGSRRTVDVEANQRLRIAPDGVSVTDQLDG